jgi:PilZ domain
MKISAEMFEAITASIRGEARHEKRKSPRVGLSGKMTIVALAPAKDRKPTLVPVRDLSATGIGILHNEDLQAGQQFNLMLESEKKEKARSIVCTVRWSQPAGPDMYSIGASFEMPAPKKGSPNPKR